MKKMIVIQGPTNHGKTLTLIKVYGILREKCGEVVDYFPDEYDIRVILHDVNGLKVGICSQGDPNSRQKEDLKCLVQEGCDIIFCAARTSGMTVENIQAYEEIYDITFVPQPFVEGDDSMQEQSNEKMARELIALAGL